MHTRASTARSGSKPRRPLSAPLALALLVTVAPAARAQDTSMPMARAREARAPTSQEPEARTPAGVQRADVTIEGARAELDTGEPLAVARAAHEAGARGWRELGPELRAALRVLGDGKRPLNEAQGQARDALVDALLRLNLPLGNDELTRCGAVERLLPLLLAHAAFDPAACAPWLRSIVAADQGTLPYSLEWSCAAALLARGAPELAAPLLARRARPEVSVVVRARWQLALDEQKRPVFGHCGTARLAFGTRKALPNFPPLVHVQLMRGNSDAHRTVLEAPLAFGLARTATAELSLAPRGTADPVELAEDAFRILAWLARDDAPAELDLLSARPEIALGWSSPERYVDEATERIAHLESRWRALVAALAKRGWLDADAARAEDRPLVVRVEDLRRAPAASLPALPGR